MLTGKFVDDVSKQRRSQQRLHGRGDAVKSRFFPRSIDVHWCAPFLPRILHCDLWSLIFDEVQQPAGWSVWNTPTSLTTWLDSAGAGDKSSICQLQYVIHHSQEYTPNIDVIPGNHLAIVWQAEQAVIRTVLINNSRLSQKIPVGYQRFGASDSNSRHTAPPINVFDIDIDIVSV